MAAPAKSVYEIKYENDIDSLKPAGIFSFTLYFRGNGLDEAMEKPTAMDQAKYIYGISTYLSMCHSEEWKGWKVFIHTNEDTIKHNPVFFTFLREHGVIIATVSIPTDILPSSIHLLRIARYYPMFMFECPVCVRDADTIFPDLALTNYFNGFDEESDDFMKKLSRWEIMYLSQIHKHGAMVNFAYDKNYYYAKDFNAYNEFENAGNYVVTATSKPHVRLLAGIVSKVGGYVLPMKLWEPNLSRYIGNISKRLAYMDGYAGYDEMYLTYVVYTYCKNKGISGLLHLQYVVPSSRDFNVVLAKFEESHPEHEIREISEYKKLSDFARDSGSLISVIKQKIFMIEPELQLGDESFGESDIGLRFGGTRRRFQKRTKKTHKRGRIPTPIHKRKR